jgi:hypothetical protein
MTTYSGGVGDGNDLRDFGCVANDRNICGVHKWIAILTEITLSVRHNDSIVRADC